MNKYIFILTDESDNPMMETLNYYQKRMAKAVQDPVFLDSSDKSHFMDNISRIDGDINEDTVVVMFNNRGFTASFDGKSLYWATKNVKLINILVDHPFYYTDMLLMAPKNMRLGLVDRHFVSMLTSWLPSIGKNSFFFPHGGTDLGLSIIPFEERPIDVLYVGSRYSNEVSCPPLDFLPDNGNRFYDYAWEAYYEDPYVEEDGIVERYLADSSTDASVSQKIMMTVCLLKSLKFQVMHEMKTRLVEALTSSGIHMTIHGNGWEDLAEKYPDRITIGEWLDSEGCIREIGRSKITLNMMPFFRDGDHERIYNAILSGSVMVSNRSRYLEECFSENEDIIFTDNKIDDTVSRIKDILSDPGKWFKIQSRAYDKARNCTWEDRMRKYIL